MIIYKSLDNFYENLENYNSKNKIKLLAVFHNVIAETETNEKLSPILTELFLRGRKLSILLVFKSQSYFKLPVTIKLNATHYSINNKEKNRTPTYSIRSFF